MTKENITILSLLFIIVLSFVFLCGCIEQTEKETALIDGKAEEWRNIPIFIPEDVEDIDIFENVTLTENGVQKVIKSYNYDVKAIKIMGSPDDLYISIELADPLDDYFKRNRENKAPGGAIGTIYIDIDNNKSTGGEEFFTNLAGFDKKLTVLTKTSLSGDYSVMYWLETYDAEENRFDFFNMFEKEFNRDPDYIGVSENFIVIRVPSNEIGISKGQTIRVIFSEQGAKGSCDESFSEEIIKKL